jgi:hypothetical protein
MVCAALVTALCVVDWSFASSHGGSAEPAEEEVDHAGDAMTRGIELGEFHLRSHYPVQAQKSIVRFVLYAISGGEHLAETRRLVKAREHRIRDQVIIATRQAPLADFDAPDLKRFRRRILLRLRRALPELILDDIYISDFQLKVQHL